MILPKRSKRKNQVAMQKQHQSSRLGLFVSSDRRNQLTMRHLRENMDSPLMS
ncbi:unnamed protein product [Brassica oleracea]